MCKSDEISIGGDEQKLSGKLPAAGEITSCLGNRLRQLVAAVLKERNAFTMESAVETLAKLEKDDGVSEQQARSRAEEQIQFSSEAMQLVLKRSEGRHLPGVSWLAVCEL